MSTNAPTPIDPGHAALLPDGLPVRQRVAELAEMTEAESAEGPQLDRRRQATPPGLAAE